MNTIDTISIIEQHILFMFVKLLLDFPFVRNNLKNHKNSFFILLIIRRQLKKIHIPPSFSN